MSSEHEANLAKLRADFDQTREAFKELAGNCGGFYQEAVANGFDAAQALQLTIGIFAALITKPPAPED